MLGQVVELPDEDFDAATAVMGCAPAYLALAVEAIADAGAADGLDPELARKLVVETTAGTAELLRITLPPSSAKLSPRPAAAPRPGSRRLTGRAAARPSKRRSRPPWRGCGGDRARVSRDNAADYVNALFIVYIILIFANILISFIPRMPFQPGLRAVLDFITETTNPYLNLFRRFLPPLGSGGFALDLSPVIG